MSIKFWLFWFSETYNPFLKVLNIHLHASALFICGHRICGLYMLYVCASNCDCIKREYKGLHPFSAHGPIDRSLGFRASFFRDRGGLSRAYWKLAREPNRFAIFEYRSVRCGIRCLRALRFNAQTAGTYGRELSQSGHRLRLCNRILYSPIGLISLSHYAAAWIPFGRIMTERGDIRIEG